MGYASHNIEYCILTIQYVTEFIDIWGNQLRTLTCFTDKSCAWMCKSYISWLLTDNMLVSEKHVVYRNETLARQILQGHEITGRGRS